MSSNSIKALLLFNTTLIALGNDAAINPGGHGPTTLGEFQGDESVIRMVSEKIDIRFSKTESEVHCRFVFRSGKTGGDAIQLVGFPDMLEREDYAGFIRKLDTYVDGRKVESRKERGWFAAEPFGSPKCGLGKAPPELRPEHVQLADFHVVTVTFPPDKDVVIERHYLANNGIDVFGTIWFGYNTHTGAVWRGTIGQADFHIKLDGLTVDDLAFEDGPQKNPPRSQWGWCAPNRAEWEIISPTDLTMTWKDFEPAVHQTRRGIKLATWSKGLPDMKRKPASTRRSPHTRQAAHQTETRTDHWEMGFWKRHHGTHARRTFPDMHEGRVLTRLHRAPAARRQRQSTRQGAAGVRTLGVDRISAGRPPPFQHHRRQPARLRQPEPRRRHGHYACASLGVIRIRDPFRQ